MDYSNLDNSPARIRQFLSEHGLAPQKRWGQNFMTSPHARARVVDLLEAKKTDTVWEIGPGVGSITSMLIGRCNEVTVFEIDHGLIRVLQERFGTAVSIVEGDAVKSVADHAGQTNEPPDLIVGNLPYRSAAPIVAAILESHQLLTVRRFVITVQREMAVRMAARAGSKEYSPFSVLCGLSGSVRIVGDLPGSSFYPAPDVVSSLVIVEPEDTDRALVARAARCARALFANRRKKIRNNLPGLASSSGVSRSSLELGLAECKIDESLRAEMIGHEKFMALARWISARVTAD